MADLEKVIKGLECCVLRDPDDKQQCDDCPYRHPDGVITNSPCANGLMGNALSLLKAQKPRVMTLTETKTMNAPVFFEIKSGVIYDWVMRCNANEKYVFFAIRNGTIQTYRVDRYGISWRCWTSRPTDEQREKVKWNENKA